MSHFPLGAYVGPNLITTQLLAAAGANGPLGSAKDITSPTAPGLPLFARIPSLQDYAAAGQQQPYLPHPLAAAMSDPMLYNALNGSYDAKENAEAIAAWRHLAGQSGGNTPAGLMPFDNPANMVNSFQYPGYPGMDLNGARRKNATRETTSTLKAWLYEHRKNPYPTKGEKIMLAIITKMTLTQVSTWFANARRRLKKENKMTWSPRNRTGDGSSVDGDEEESKNEDLADDDCSIDLSDFDAEDKETTHDTQNKEEHRDTQTDDKTENITTATEKPKSNPEMDKERPASKPRIWSIADVATSKPTIAHHNAPTSSVRHRPYPTPNPAATFRPWFDAAAYRQFGMNPFANPLMGGRPTIPVGLRVPHLGNGQHQQIGHPLVAPSTSTGSSPSSPIRPVNLSPTAIRTDKTPERTTSSNPAVFRPMKLEV